MLLRQPRCRMGCSRCYLTPASGWLLTLELAVAFADSRRGGLALRAIAQARPQPIPFFAEMSSVNPVFVWGRRILCCGA